MIPAAFFRYASIGFSAATAFVLVYNAVKAPSRVAGHLGRRGMKRRQAIARNETWAKAEPFVRWLGVRVSGVVPNRVAQNLDLQILYAGDYLGLTADEYVGLHLVGLVAGFLMGFAIDAMGTTHGMAAFGFMVLGAMAPYLQISATAIERRQRCNRGLPFAVDQISLSMSAGLDFPAALRQVVSKAQPDDPLAEELGYMLQNLQLGHTRRSALIDFGERVPTDAVKEFVQTIVQAEERGNPVADVLQIQATVSRQRRTTLAEEAASKAGVRMVIPLALIFITVILLILGPILLTVKDSVKQTNGNSKKTSAIVVAAPNRGTA